MEGILGLLQNSENIICQLKKYGCNAAQGYYYARLMTVEEFQKRKGKHGAGRIDRRIDRWSVFLFGMFP